MNCESYSISSHTHNQTKNTPRKTQMGNAPSSMSWSSVRMRMMFGRTFRRSLCRRDRSLWPERCMVPSEGQRNVRMKTRRRVAGLHQTAMTLTCLPPPTLVRKITVSSQPGEQNKTKWNFYRDHLGTTLNGI